MRPIVGIDLGTTYSLVGALQAGQPVLFPNAIGERLTPSAVSVGGDGSFLVGAPARARAATHPLVTALAFRRDMGTERTWTLGGRNLRATDLSGMVLAALKADAEAALGESIDEAVLTVPAYFDELQRQATRDAGAIAGLRVERIINEPTAAALAYGLHERSRQMRACVLDLGGGTFDVTVLEIVDGVIEIQATAGDARLGGEDFADALAALVLARLPPVFGTDPVARARVREAAESAKRRLTTETEARVVLPALEAGGRSLDVEERVTRAEFEEACAALVDRVRGPAFRALHDAGVRPESIDEVLLVGGATRMPAIHRLASQLFGRMPLRALPPDEAVAIGAAVQAALKAGDAAVADMIVTDVAPFTLGIASGARMDARAVTGLYSPIIDRGTTIPVSRSERFFTMADDQREIVVDVFQGEHAMCRDNRKLGTLRVTAIPSGPEGSESVDVRFTYDINGILEVETTVTSTGAKHALLIEQVPGRLSTAQVEAARVAMSKLKFHPRELLPNANVIARAEALFVELVGDSRVLLGQALSGFRLSLESQNTDHVNAGRASLLALVDRLDRRADP